MMTINVQNTIHMGKMGQIAALIQDGRSSDLDSMIKASERTGRSEVYFLGKTYTLAEAKHILKYMQDAEHKIHRNKFSSQ